MSVWHSSQVIGKNNLANIVKSQLKLGGYDFEGKIITSTSERKTAIDGSMSKSMPGAYVSQNTGHRGYASKLDYMPTNEVTLKAANRTLQDVMAVESSNSKEFVTIFAEEKAKEYDAI